jgi:hypothetical protein
MTRNAQQQQTERRTKRTGCNEAVGPQGRLHPGQRKGADDGTDADRTQQDAVEFGAARNLIARDERKQSPICTRKEEERDRSCESCAQIGIASRIPEADHDGARETFRWKAGPLRRWRLPPEQGSYDAKNCSMR